MADQRTYLELSEDSGSSHKFYEVTISGSSVTIRYGRIGDKGQAKTTKYKNPAEALAEATQQIGAKKKKGYAEAVMGQRAKRSVGERTTTSTVALHGTTRAPVLWHFSAGSAAALGIFIDDELCWIGNQNGDVFAVGHDGKVARKFKLPGGVMCLVRDEDWLYCGCNDGNVYDLSRKIPFVAYEIAESINIYWIDIHDGSLAVSDAGGGLTVLDHDCDLLWQKKSPGASGWMVRADSDAVYHGYNGGVTAYDWPAGKAKWTHTIDGAVLFGWQEPSAVYAGTTRNVVQAISKQGKTGLACKCDGTVYSCAAAGDGKYVFAGDSSSSVYCFDHTGKRLWKLDTTCGSALSMQFHNDRLYIVTSQGTLACIDVSEAAISAAQAGTLPKAAVVAAAPTLQAAQAGDRLEAAPASATGVLVECYSEDGRVRVRPKSPGFKADWHVQFPRDIRTPGTTYLVDGLRESGSGGFYRVVGQIRTATGDAVPEPAAKTTAKKQSKR
jgi:predicted DNA-binding WGR domain protein/outer membrane protein assembly factor BamB